MASELAVARVMVLFGETWTREITDGLISIYDAAFSDLSDDELMVGAWGCIEESKFFPTPGEVLDRSGTRRSAEVAWELVKLTSNTSELPPEIAETVRSLGGLGFIREGDYRWMRSDFMKAYAEFSARTRTEKRRLDKRFLPMITKLVAKLEGRDLPALPSGEKDNG